MENEQKTKNNSLLIKALIACCVISVITSFYFFYYKKDFNFIVEVSCDKSQETCFERDCSNPDDCPPNGLSDFKRYSLNANDFKSCQNEDCTTVCENGEIKCTPVECTENPDTGETCVSPQSSESVQ